ncbi:nuclear factor nf-kappa-b p105 subunit [Fagus crenata]
MDTILEWFGGQVMKLVERTFTNHESYFLKDQDKKLFQSAVKGEWNEVLKICEDQVWSFNIPVTMSSGDTVFHLAAYNNLEDIFVTLLIRLPWGAEHAMATLKRANNKGNTPLHLAASVGSVKMCSCVLFCTESTTLLSVRNNEGETPLFLAALHGHKDAFLLLHSFCGPEEGYNYCKRNDGETILHCAISEEYYELSLLIVRLYRDLVNLANKDGMTPLHLLASKPSAFKSGCDLRWFENIIYHCKYTINFTRLIVYQYHRIKLSALP